MLLKKFMRRLLRKLIKKFIRKLIKKPMQQISGSSLRGLLGSVLRGSLGGLLGRLGGVSNFTRRLQRFSAGQNSYRTLGSDTPDEPESI